MFDKYDYLRIQNNLKHTLKNLEVGIWIGLTQAKLNPK